MNKARAGLIGIVNQEAKLDFWGTMERVAAIGYQGIEGEERLLHGDVDENIKRFHDLGLKVLTISARREELLEQVDSLAAKAKSLHTNRVTIWWAPCDSRQAVLEDAAIYNEAGLALASRGVTLCYHHHEHEFRNFFDGDTAMDILIRNTDPEALQFVVDIAWATFGGANPSAVIRQLQGRVASLHVKDLSRLDERNHFTAVGTGLVDIQASVRTGIETGVEWAVVEQDTLRNLDAFETATLSYLYLKEAGLV